MELRVTLANNVKTYRKRARLTQEQLAHKTGLHRTYIGGIEQQRINTSIDSLQKIAQALEVQVWELLKPLP